MPLHFTAKRLSLNKREMACVLKIAVVVSAIIAAVKQCDASDGYRQVHTENSWKELWNSNAGLLRLRTTSKTFNKCFWYMVDSCDDRSVNVTLWVFHVAHGRGRGRGTAYGTFGQSSNMSWATSLGVKSVWNLLYLENSSSCGVIEIYYMDDNDDDKVEYTDGPYFDLLVGAEYKVNVPEKCTTYYEEKIKGRSETKNPDEEVVECKPREGTI